MVFIFACILVSGAWIGTVRHFPLTAVLVLTIAVLVYVHEFEIAVPEELKPPLRLGDWIAVAAIAAPIFAYLILTWSQEFPHGGDQVYHNGAALEAFAFWWWWKWLLAIAAVIAAVRFPSLALPMLVVLMAVAMISGAQLAFAGRYPGTFYFLGVPLHALPFDSPLNAQRLVNAMAVPVWLLVLRPLILRRRIDVASLAIALFLFWQKDLVYYFSSGYLEPWAIVLLLTAAEHLVLFGSDMIWRPLLLLSAAAMFKDQMVLTLPVVALVYFPFRGSWRERFRYLLLVGAAATPVLLFAFARRSFRSWEHAYPDWRAFNAAHFEAFAHRVQIQFGALLPLFLIGLIALAVLAIRRRAFAALLLASILNWLLFFVAIDQQDRPGYPRLNIVAVIYAAVALGAVIEWVASRRRIAAWATITVIAVLNAMMLVPLFRNSTRPDSARNFLEHSDAAMFLPVRQSIQRAEQAGFLSPGSTVSLLNNGKWTYPFFYPGPIAEQYPGLSRRYRFRIKSFAFGGNSERCRCSSGETNIAVFIRFQNLGLINPQRQNIESEAQRCRQVMIGTCGRTLPVEQEGDLVALIGSK